MRYAFQLKPVMALLFITALAGCTKSSSSPSASATQSAGASAPLTAAQSNFVSAQVQQSVNAQLNSTDTYALTPPDLQLLQDRGLLTSTDVQSLQLLVKQ